MKFEEALAAMREGKKVKNGSGYTTFIVSMDNLEEVELCEAVHADWEIYEEPKWEPKKGAHCVTRQGSVELCVSVNEACKFGIERSTHDLAIRAASKMRAFNRLLAYVDEHAPDYDPGWGNTLPKYFVYFSFTRNEYVVGNEYSSRDIAKVYMPEKVAEKLAEDLNSGRVVL